MVLAEFSVRDNAQTVALRAQSLWHNRSDDIDSGALISQIQRLPGFLHCMLLSAPDAPGLLISAGTLHCRDTINSFTGAGESLSQALASALGEAAEIVAMDYIAARNEFDQTCSSPPIDLGWIKKVREKVAQPESEVICEPYSANCSATAPAILFEQTDKARCIVPELPPVSAGTGAGKDLSIAAEHGMLELIEHDAVAHWWFGQRHASRIEVAAHPQVYAFLSRIRSDIADQRRTLLFELPASFGGCSVVAAVSFDQYGQGFSCGTAARAGIGIAAIAALREMCQIEFGHHCVRARMLALDTIKLSTPDHEYIERSQIITQDQFITELEHRKHRTTEDSSIRPPKNAASSIWIYRPDHPLADIAVCKVLCPALSPLSASLFAVEAAAEPQTDSLYHRFAKLLP